MWIYFLHIFHFISSLIKVIPLTSPSCNKNDLNSDVFLTRINFFSSYNFTHFPKRRGISLHLFCKVSSHLYLLQVTTIVANRRVANQKASLTSLYLPPLCTLFWKNTLYSTFPWGLSTLPNQEFWAAWAMDHLRVGLHDPGAQTM